MRKAGIPFWQKPLLILLGVFFAVVLLELSLRLAGLLLTSFQEYRNLQGLKKKGAYRILCLGESTTFNQYPPFLEEALSRHCKSVKFSVIDKGVPGTNTSAILSMLEADLDKINPDIVVTMMGINDPADHIFSEPVSGSGLIRFWQRFKVYKLARLLWLSRFRPDIKDGDLNEWERVKRGFNYRDQGEFQRAGLQFKKALALNPRNYKARVGLGWVLYDQGRFFEAEKSFEEAVILKPEDDWVYTEFGSFYREQGKIVEAKLMFAKALGLNPRNEKARSELARSYRIRREPEEAEKLLKEAIALDPENAQGYIKLSWFYRDRRRYSEAEEAARKAVARDPKNDQANFELGWYAWRKGDLSAAQRLFKKVMELNPVNAQASGALEMFYTETGNAQLAAAYRRKTDEIRMQLYSPVTGINYRRLKGILEKRGVIYVCVQYPARSIEQLKSYFNGDDAGIVYVDNELLFKDVMRKEGHREYFVDMFGGDFGHCSEKGNRLLAGNIAQAIMRDVLHKKGLCTGE